MILVLVAILVRLPSLLRATTCKDMFIITSTIIAFCSEIRVTNFRVRELIKIIQICVYSLWMAWLFRAVTLPYPVVLLLVMISATIGLGLSFLVTVVWPAAFYLGFYYASLF
jgi:hypothetical protein